MATHQFPHSRTCILLHAALGNRSQMAPVRAAIEKQISVYDFDFEGHGFEIPNKRFSLDSLAKQLEALLLEKQLYKPTVIGYSMGGYVALYLAAQKPGILGQIITYGTKLAWTPEFAEKETQKLNPEKIQEKVPAFYAKLAAQYGNPHWKKVVEATTDFMKTLPNQPISFASIVEPYTLLLGTEDRMVTLDETAKAASLSEKGKHQTIPGAGHDIATVPAEFWVSTIESAN